MLRRVGIDDENRPHLAVSGVVAVTILAHESTVNYAEAACINAICPALKVDLNGVGWERWISSPGCDV